MAKKNKLKTFITPKGVAVFPHLHKPDTRYDDDGVFQVKLRLTEDQVDEIIEKHDLEEIFEEFREAEKSEATGKRKAKMKKAVDKDFFEPEYDKEGEETGYYLMKATMKYRVGKEGKKRTQTPNFFDARKNMLDKAPVIWGGSVLRLSVAVKPYFAPLEQPIWGIKFYLNAVQIIELVEGGKRDADSYGFGEEEGDDLSDRDFGEGDNDSDNGFDEDSDDDSDGEDDEDF